MPLPKEALKTPNAPLAKFIWRTGNRRPPMPLPKETQKTTRIPHQQVYGWAYPLGGVSRWEASRAAVLRAVFFCRHSPLPATSSTLRPQPQSVAFCSCPLDGVSRWVARYAAVLARRRSASPAPGFALLPHVDLWCPVSSTEIRIPELSVLLTLYCSLTVVALQI